MKNIYINLIIVICIIYIFKIIYIKSSEILNNKTNYNKIRNFVVTKLNGDGKKLILLPHLELGDNIVLNGAVRYLCSVYNKVVLVCKQAYLKQLEYMYSDLDNLILYPIKGGIIENINPSSEFYYDENVESIFNDYDITFIPICMYYDYYYNKTECDRSKCGKLKYPYDFYDYLNLSGNIRYPYFKINRDYKSEDILYNNLINIIGDKYNIIIDDEKRNLIINDTYIKNNYPIFKLSSSSINKNKKLNNIKSDNIFNYIKILENAQEIHTIDSSIVHLIDSLNIKVKTYIHRYIRPFEVNYANKNFIYIN